MYIYRIIIMSHIAYNVMRADLAKKGDDAWNTLLINVQQARKM